MLSAQRLAAAALGFGIASSALRADTAAQRVLIPVYTVEPVAGVAGSSWATELWISNFSSGVVQAGGIVWDCSLPECGNLPAPIGPGVTFQPSLQGANGGLHGVLVSLTEPGADQAGLGLRFRDLSRQSATWGTELPTPRESAFRGAKFSLVDVPVTAGFRQTLRIYELDGTAREASVRVRVYRLDSSHVQPFDEPDALLGEAVVPLQFAAPFAVPPDNPGYAEVSDLSTLGSLGDAERLRIEIEPVTAGLQLWAFVTVIHNETQHATVITPH